MSTCHKPLDEPDAPEGVLRVGELLAEDRKEEALTACDEAIAHYGTWHRR